VIVRPMGTDWFVKAKCPARDAGIEEKRRACERCRYRIWPLGSEKGMGVLGGLFSYCGVRVGSVGSVAELDEIGERLTGIRRFTRRNGRENATVEQRLEILKRIKESGFEYLGLDTLIEFCERCLAKGFEIVSWS